MTWLLLSLLALATVLLTERVLDTVALRKEGPLGDAQVYFRAAWAVRADKDIYQVTDGHGWHYLYPPFLAILLRPLADAPPDVDRTGLLPFSASVMIWFALSVAALAAGVHLLAQALRPRTGGAVVLESRDRWWLVRIAPVLACLPAIAWTLTRGQVGLLVLLCLCAMLFLLARGRSLTAGLCLGAAVCVKLIPGFLLVYPLWRRDWRCVLGTAAMMAVGLVVLPAAVLGPERTAACFREEFGTVLGPGLGLSESAAREQELFSLRDNYSQSFLVMLHNLRYPDRDTRPEDPSTELRLTHWLISAALTLMTLLAYWRCQRYGGGNDVRATLLVGGELMLLMPQISPVCHAHYFILALPLFLTLYSMALEQYGRPRLNSPMGWLFVSYVTANALPWAPGLDFLRDGLAGWANVALWAIGLVALWRYRPHHVVESTQTSPLRTAA